MPIPTENKTVQSRMLEYTGNSDWSIVSREGTEQGRDDYPTARIPVKDHVRQTNPIP